MLMTLARLLSSSSALGTGSSFWHPSKEGMASGQYYIQFLDSSVQPPRLFPRHASAFMLNTPMMPVRPCSYTRDPSNKTLFVESNT